MKKFEAQHLDLILELTTLGGEELTLEPKLIMNAENVMNIVNKWEILEKKQKEEKEDKDKLSPLEIVAENLAMIYPRDKIWFLQNFDFGTLNAILKYVAETLAQLKKNEKNSK